MSLSPAIDGSRLCLECGICCQGVLHREASVEAGEIEAVRRLGLQVIGSGKDLSFRLPCPLHQGDRCTAYMDRPRTCRSYQCKLLKGYLEGTVDWEHCRRTIGFAKDLVDRIRRGINLADPDQCVWEEIRSLTPDQLAALVQEKEVLLDVVSLLTVSRRHFQNRASPLEVLGP